MNVTYHTTSVPSSSMTNWASADALLATMAQLPPQHPQRGQLRRQVIHQCLPEARREAARFRSTGESFDDLAQVAVLGLILAVDRCDRAAAVRSNTSPRRP